MYLRKTSKYLYLSFIILLYVIISSCGGGDSSSTGNSYTIKVNHDSSVIFNNAKIKIILLGTDKTIQDNTATVISETIINIEKLPSSLILTWPDSAYKLINNPAVKSKENAVYYFSINIDENNDGLLCNNDYQQDYTKIPFKTISNKPSEITNFYVTLKTTKVCSTF
jgi:hypothetical protein